MKKKGKRTLIIGALLSVLFLLFTWLVQNVDVRPMGVNGTCIGFSTLNCAFHDLCGVHMTLYNVTDWAGLVPISVTASFALVGLIQWIKRKHLFKVDRDILLLGAHYFTVMMLYVVFQLFPVNYRPILIDGNLEASYPSSTVLLVVAVMPTLSEQINRRYNTNAIKRTVTALTYSFTVFIVVGRLFSGVHWFTDVVGSVMIGVGTFLIYRGFVCLIGNDA